MQGKRTLRWWGGLSLGLMATGLLMGAVAALSTSQRPEVVVRINGEALSREALINRLLERGGQAILREMVYDHLLLQEAARRGVTVSDADLQEEEQRLGQRFPSQEEFDRWKQDNARRWADLRQALRMQVLFRRLVDSEVEVSQAEVAAYYQEHRQEFTVPRQVEARGILVETRENADALRLALEQPEADFAALAREFSLDPASKDEGGALGWIQPGAYTEEIDRVLFALEPGQLSEPVETPDGFFLLQILKAKPERQQELDEVRSAIEGRLADQQRRELESTYLDRLRRQARIEVLWPELEPLWDG